MNFMIHYNTITGGGVDYDSGPYSVTIPAGNTNVSFDINITIDNLVEDDEEFYLSIDPSSLSSNINTSSPYQTTVNIVNTNSKLLKLSHRTYMCKPFLIDDRW